MIQYNRESDMDSRDERLCLKSRGRPAGRPAVRISPCIIALRWFRSGYFVVGFRPVAPLEQYSCISQVQLLLKIQ